MMTIDVAGIYIPGVTLILSSRYSFAKPPNFGRTARQIVKLESHEYSLRLIITPF